MVYWAADSLPYYSKDSYRYGQNTPTLIFENLKPVEESKNHINII